VGYVNHRSGFADEWDAVLLTQASMGNRFDVSQFLNLLYTQPKEEVVHRKGYMYSNSDFGLLRLLLEKASGENLRDWMKQKMFDPLGMKATLLHDNANEVIPNLAGHIVRYLTKRIPEYFGASLMSKQVWFYSMLQVATAIL
jgi:CubicO group peptidase (beta-lactamase class C family)